MIFAILKVTGYILLAVIALFIAVVLLILFMPVKYRAKGSFDKTDVSVKADAAWLFHLMSGHIEYGDDVSAWYRILFWKKTLFESEEEEEETYENDPIKAETKEVGSQTESKQEQAREQAREQTQEQTHEAHDADVVFHVENKEKIKRNKFFDIKEKHGGTFNKIKSIVSDESNKAALGHLKEEIFLVLKRVCPKKLKLDLKFSTGEPDTTGIALGIIAMFPICYKNKWNIKCDFESDKPYAEGGFDVKGRIFIISVLGAVIRIVLDKNCRRLYNKVMN